MVNFMTDVSAPTGVSPKAAPTPATHSSNEAHREPPSPKLILSKESASCRVCPIPLKNC